MPGVTSLDGGITGGTSASVTTINGFAFTATGQDNLDFNVNAWAGAIAPVSSVSSGALVNGDGHTVVGALGGALSGCFLQTFAGTVSRISQSVDVATRTMSVELDVHNADARLAPGTFCQVAWPLHRVPLDCIPRHCGPRHCDH
jgi:hypothetical protein